MAKAVKLSGIIDVYLQMKITKEISNELNNISPLLAGIEKKNIFSVPEGYFDVLSINILKRIETPSSEFKNDRLSVPEGYFENLSTSVLQKIRSLNETAEQELRTLSPMLYSLQNENVFEVPAGYFRNLANDILNNVIQKPQAKIVHLNKSDSVWKYAAAAVVTGVIGLSSLMMFDAQNSGGGKPDESISSSIQIAAQFKSEQQITAAIANLSEDDIIKYLEKTGNDVDNEVLATSVDENDLPAANDYLLDDKTLDTYLDKTDKNTQN